MRALSRITQDLLGQPMFAVAAEARKLERPDRKIIHFEIGDPDFDTPECVVRAAKEALDRHLTHYTDSMGTAEFRTAVAEYIRADHGFTPAMAQILACPANALIDFAVRCVADPGDEIIYPDPGFPTYHAVIVYNQMKPVGVPLAKENGFRMDPEEVRRRITHKTRLIIINTPQNPTGSVMTQEQILGIAGIAESRGIYLLADEVYSKIVFGKKHYSPAAVDRCLERTILLSSLSKVYSMSGWRLGYAVGPEKLIGKMGLLLQTTLSCLPGFTQAGGAAILSADQGFFNERLEELQKRRDILVEGLNTLYGVTCPVPEGAFYVFPDIRGTGMACGDYSRQLLEEFGVCVLPGNCFGRYGEGHVRLCYASTPVPVIREALERMRCYHDRLPGAARPAEGKPS